MHLVAFQATIPGRYVNKLTKERPSHLPFNSRVNTGLCFVLENIPSLILTTATVGRYYCPQFIKEKAGLEGLTLASEGTKETSNSDHFETEDHAPVFLSTSE